MSKKYLNDPEKYCYTVYAHINKINGKVYVGITHMEPKKRWCNGKNYWSCTKFLNAINKYGWDGFEHKILHEHIDRETACILERMYISFYKKRNISYNSANGGDGPGTVSEETRYKLHLASSGKNNAMYGKPRSIEVKQKISNALKGEKSPNYGKKFSEETIKKMVENHWDCSGKNNPMYGKHLSEESRKKLSESHKGRYIGKDNPFYGTGRMIKVDDDPIIYTVAEAAEKYSISGALIRKYLKNSNIIKISSMKTKLTHIVTEVKK